MKLREFLDREAVVASLHGEDKSAVLEELATEVAKRSDGKVSPDEAKARLVERERDRGCTGIGSGVAVPHARAKVDRVIAVFARSPKGVEFGAADHLPVHLFFALVSPESQPGVHLTALARIAKLLKSDALRRRLIEAPDADGLWQILADEDARV